MGLSTLVVGAILVLYLSNIGPDLDSETGESVGRRAGSSSYSSGGGLFETSPLDGTDGRGAGRVAGPGGAWDRVGKMLGRNRGGPVVEEDFLVQDSFSGLAGGMGGEEEEDDLWVDLDDDMPLTTFEGGKLSFLIDLSR